MTTQTLNSHLLVESVHGITVARLTDEMLVSEEAIFGVDGQLLGLVESSKPERFLLNFSEVRAMSSTMLAVLLKIGRKVAAQGGRLKLCGLSPDLFEIFKITRFDRIFETYSEEWEALDAF
ncbi:STAS domain-containing protein [Singulisphaera sp. PoT]|uniref:STAS domain-containing protein n=1 Tax=Singulisphaera sp. PoT TaxID=3411797 RepID=UPI003BF4F218